MLKSEELKVLLRIEQLLLLLAKTQLAPVLQQETGRREDGQLYELTGSHGQREIKKKLNMSADTISSSWKRWEKMGLLIRDGQEYRKVI